MTPIQITLENNSKFLILPDLEKELSTYLKSQIASEKVVLELIISGPKKLQMLNKKYRGKDAPTDVLSFPIYHHKKELPNNRLILLGTIVINLAQAKDQAKQKGISLTDESIFLAKHSLDHLLGKHH